MSDHSTYILLDTALMADAESKPWTKSKRRPGWLIPLYDRSAWDVSPVIVDIEAAYKSNRIDLVTTLLNHRQPQVHASFIDTSLAPDALAEHLRQFIYVLDDEGSELTLRIADCIVLPWLQSAMTPEQWAAVHGPILRWGIHGRDGKLSVLPAPTEAVPAVAPLTLNRQQIAMLCDAHEPDQLLANMRAMRPAHRWGDTPQIEIKLAEDTLRVWTASSQTDRTTLLLLARGVFDTKGGLLRFPALRQILEQRDPAIIQKDIQNAVDSHLRNN